MPDSAPLILTAELEEPVFDWFEALRRAHFPPERNLVPAHLTLFHALPGAHEAAVAEVLKAACARTVPPEIAVRGPWSLGRGVAYRLESSALSRLRAELAEAFAPWLTAQDRAPFRPHVTVQNKVDPQTARRLLERLQAEFAPFETVSPAVRVWRYRGGPWEAVGRVAFTGSARADPRNPV